MNCAATIGGLLGTGLIVLVIAAGLTRELYALRAKLKNVQNNTRVLIEGEGRKVLRMRVATDGALQAVKVLAANRVGGPASLLLSDTIRQLEATLERE